MFQNYVVLDSNETVGMSIANTVLFQNYVVLDSNETIANVFNSFFMFQNYVVLDSNETATIPKIINVIVLELCCFRQ